MTIVRSVVLGGAQLGMCYGIAGNDFLGARAAFALLDKAHYFGFRTWDLAQSYGCAEYRAALWLRSHNRKNCIANTKNLKVGFCKSKLFEKSLHLHFGTKIHIWEPEALEEVRTQLNRSRRYLVGYARLPYILLHSVQPQKLAAQLRALKRLQKNGEKIGISLYYPQELETLWREQERGNCPPLDIIQLPYSIADRRFAPYFCALQKSGVELQLRSLYLQGLLFAPQQAASPFFASLAPLLCALREWETGGPAICNSVEFGGSGHAPTTNRTDLLLYAALRYAHGCKPDFAPNQLKIVLGASNTRELILLYQSLKRLNLAFFNQKSGAALRRKLEEPMAELESLAKTLQENIVVPALWPK